jgi:hypothetical protein
VAHSKTSHLVYVLNTRLKHEIIENQLQEVMCGGGRRLIV